jgi:gamma-glutamyl:cysteine ligase YbdK (ATP-grasp superfamily)
MQNVLQGFLDLFPNLKKGEEVDFRSNGILTLGVEVELQILDPETLVLTPRAEEILKVLSSNKKITKEFFLSTLEINTAKCGDAIRFNNFFLNFIPHLIALSASSPFWQVDDTGLAACRPTTYESLPTAYSSFGKLV